MSAPSVLIYVSLYERRALVIGDTTVREAIGQGVFAELCRLFAEKIASGHPVDAFVETIQATGDKLAGPLPRNEKSGNELPDALVVLD
jgi:putative membrane protein